MDVVAGKLPDHAAFAKRCDEIVAALEVFDLDPRTADLRCAVRVAPLRRGGSPFAKAASRPGVLVKPRAR